MARRRRVGNLMGLAILSAVAFRQMHPYEMASTLRGWGKESDLEIKWGSFYTVVGNLAKHGFLNEVESTREGRRPERTVYRITEAGRAELVDWIRELLSAAEREHPRFRAGLSVMSALAPDEVTGLLQQRLAELEQRISALDETLAHEAEKVPRLFLIEAEYDRAMLTAEAAWMRSLIAELLGGTLPGLAEWRRAHDTGEIPDEMRRLAESHINPDAEQ
ncbi:PadR family transcriptional regulator [Actinoplanes sp. OR16]|uniref:PadR family transcriptional regulator n=1 Tax=Actinoplanes sp. OR16 TaxID=946334 RepID=UPI000F6E7722|nr:PadR family transcriptional regulator [Actinoplanes sp. OR16]BBH67785.1 PadR family transcriptional regulator [Actinoplanes sp. OR16]